MKKVVIVGVAYPFRGGLASFSERLAEEYQQQGYEVDIYTFTLQYPSILFPGKTQYSSSPAPKHLNIKQTFSSINPLTWYRTGQKIGRQKPDLVICKFWLPFMGPCLGTILKVIRKHSPSTRFLSIIDNIVPHEKRIGDQPLAQYFVNQVDAFIVMSRSVRKEMKDFVKKQEVRYIPHPIYDNYGEILSKKQARDWLKIPVEEKVILFFGFIRDYKGLDLLLEAMADERIRQEGIKLIIAGEFYANQEKYERLIDQLAIREQLILKTDFIPNEEVKYYFSAANLAVQPYKTATQSGISQLCYHFEKPMVVTNVGGLPEIVPDGEVGYVVERTPKAVADAILRFFKNNKEQSFSAAVKIKKKEFGWNRLVEEAESLLFESPKTTPHPVN